MKDEDRGSELPERGPAGKSGDGHSEAHRLPKSERRVLSGRRRFEKSSNWSLALAGILLIVLIVLMLISRMLES